MKIRYLPVKIRYCKNFKFKRSLKIILLSGKVIFLKMEKCKGNLLLKCLVMLVMNIFIQNKFKNLQNSKKFSKL